MAKYSGDPDWCNESAASPAGAGRSYERHDTQEMPIPLEVLEQAEKLQSSEKQPGKQPRKHSRIKRWMAIGGIGGLFCLGDAVNAGSMVSSGCSYMVKETKDAAFALRYTTPAELVEELQETFAQKEKEIRAGDYRKEILAIEETLDQYKTDEVKATELKQALFQPTVEALFSRLYAGDGKTRDKYIQDLVKSLEGNLSMGERKKRALLALDNLQSEFTVEEKKDLAQKVAQLYKPEERYKAQVNALVQQNKVYSAMQELAKYLTPQQWNSLAGMVGKSSSAAVVTATAAAAGAKAVPGTKGIKTAAPPVKPATPPARPTATKPADQEKREPLPIDLVQQKAREMAAAGRDGGT